MTSVPLLTIDSATKLDQRHRGAVVVCGSHGGIYPAYLAARARLRAVILCDAGVGKDRAGIGCLDYCAALGMAAATVDVMSACIADGADMLRRGRISHVNALARRLGCAPGQPALEAQEMLADAPAWRGEPPAYPEARATVADEPGRPRVVCLDSVSLVVPEDAGQIVITGSHGGTLGGRPDPALGVDALAALFNDAGIGRDEAGVSRLPVLDQRGIAGAAVDVMTARIGDGRSTYEDGVLSRVNRTAHALGGRPGMTARDFVQRILDLRAP
jgi:hypothetical protein